ncbi:hypothetical protein KC19_3G019200 [Ceratodon purpureus]|uniref:Uncharacterized protein n=1 Tax=Ceratodon purpureus TaxID=3225 RepID=A0A8T0IG74_CERPU|nr:hypothetical protein KC19_3G019200 [Ceratodon purpureus]
MDLRHLLILFVLMSGFFRSLPLCYFALGFVDLGLPMCKKALTSCCIRSRGQYLRSCKIQQELLPFSMLCRDDFEQCKKCAHVLLVFFMCSPNSGLTYTRSSLSSYVDFILSRTFT